MLSHRLSLHPETQASGCGHILCLEPMCICAILQHQVGKVGGGAAGGQVGGAKKTGGSQAGWMQILMDRLPPENQEGRHWLLGHLHSTANALISLCKLPR